MELDDRETQTLLKRLPEFKLSYETVSHKKVSHYDTALAIPYGKKMLCWFSYDNENNQNNVCYCLTMNKSKEYSSCIKMTHQGNYELGYNTLLYGTLYQEDNNQNKYFIIEDIFYYCGVQLPHFHMIEKWDLISSICSECSTLLSRYRFFICCPIIWKHPSHCDYAGIIPKDIESTISYNIHHIQYRSNYNMEPYLNVKTQQLSMLKQVKKTKDNISTYASKYDCKYNKNLKSHYYKKPCVFVVKADIQSDIYHLFAFGKNNTKEYYDVAYIPNYNISCKMNTLFRKIKENNNIDYIEESDDEEDFQDVNPFKYVDVNKELLMTFVFNYKFKRWCPTGIAKQSDRIIHIGKLVYNYNNTY